MTDHYILVLYYSKDQSVKTMAQHIANGIESCDMHVKIRQVYDQDQSEQPGSPLQAQLDDLKTALV